MKMNNKANINLSLNTIVYLVILVVFVAVFWVFVSMQKDGAARWEDYYVKEIVKVVNSAEIGDEIVLDVHDATVIAKSKGVEFGNIFGFSDERREVCVKLAVGRQTCFPYFNDVVIVEPRIEYGKGEPAVNTLHFRIEESKAGEVINDNTAQVGAGEIKENV